MRSNRRLAGFAAALALSTAALGFAVAGPAQAAGADRPADAGVADFYRARGGAALWLAPNSGYAAQYLLQLLSTAQLDGLDPRRYDVRGLSRALAKAQSRDPRAVGRAEMMFSEAFVAYASDLSRDPGVGVIYVDPELRPTPLPARTLLSQAATAPSLGEYVQRIGWINPTYGQLRQALVNRRYSNEHQRRLIALNLQRARTLPFNKQRYVVVNPVAQRLYMYENGEVVDSMRVVAGKPEAATPMMTAFIRFAVLNPYWNSPPDITANRLAPNVLKQGKSYLRAKGYDVMSDWTDNARVMDASAVDWRAVVAGRTQIRLRQRPGPANSMGKMKFMFPNKEGIWLHDTPSKDPLGESERLVSAGCVRLEDAPRFARWLFGQPVKPQGAKPEQKVPLPALVPLYITYLTAVPSGSSITYFDDMYGLDRRRMA
jgi:murein L,D-transpeptidase YcbB/YkuD